MNKNTKKGVLFGVISFILLSLPLLLIVLFDNKKIGDMWTGTSYDFAYIIFIPVCVSAFLASSIMSDSKKLVIGSYVLTGISLIFLLIVTKIILLP
jgi:hypothetical protein